MASIRQLKKDLNYVVRDFVEDAYFLVDVYPDRQTEIEAVIDQLYEEYDKMISLIHHPELKRKKHAFGKDPQKKKLRNKEHAKKIKQATAEFLNKVNFFYDKIDEILGTTAIDENVTDHKNEKAG